MATLKNGQCQFGPSEKSISHFEQKSFHALKTESFKTRVYETHAVITTYQCTKVEAMVWTYSDRLRP